MLPRHTLSPSKPNLTPYLNGESHYGSPSTYRIGPMPTSLHQPNTWESTWAPKLPLTNGIRRYSNTQTELNPSPSQVLHCRLPLICTIPELYRCYHMLPNWSLFPNPLIFKNAGFCQNYHMRPHSISLARTFSANIYGAPTKSYPYVLIQMPY